jgi:hypothetical protein
VRARAKMALRIFGRVIASLAAIEGCVLVALITLATICAPAFAVDNDQFAAEIDGAKPVLWKDYELLDHDFVGCIAGIEPARLTHAACAHLDERRGRMLWDALKQATLLNVASSHKPKFCAARVTKVVVDHDAVEGGTMAAYLIEIQLHGGAGPYGADLPVTYLGKIVYDALVKISPCK